ncbi:MAG: hypothetical protein P4M00_18210 [Azospirillaceae bacterium]|nr:hypothetical protein [Azospirillaceae bacterium]
MTMCGTMEQGAGAIRQATTACRDRVAAAEAGHAGLAQPGMVCAIVAPATQLDLAVLAAHSRPGATGPGAVAPSVLVSSHDRVTR